MQETKFDQFSIRQHGPLTVHMGREKQNDNSSGQIYLELPYKGLVIAPRGQLEVELLFRGLPLALAVARECHQLTVDLSQTLGLDDLAVSALVVLLRNYARGFGRIVLQGLPMWAVERLCDVGVDKLLGHGWVCAWEVGKVRYWLCRA